MKIDRKILAFSFAALGIAAIILGVSMVTTNVRSAVNGTVTTRVWVWNTEPNLYEVEIKPDTITLSPGNTTRVNCTAYVYDSNGWQDVNVTNATFYHSDYQNENADEIGRAHV